MDDVACSVMFILSISLSVAMSGHYPKAHEKTITKFEFQQPVRYINLPLIILISILKYNIDNGSLPRYIRGFDFASQVLHNN